MVRCEPHICLERSKLTKKNIGVIGLGRIGLPLAVVLSKHFSVYGVDIDSRRIRDVQRAQTSEDTPFFEPMVNEYLKDHQSSLTPSTEYNILRNCETVFIITQSPSTPEGKFDISYVRSALKKLHKVNPSCTAVVSSTINIGDIDTLKRVHERVAYNPEFIKQGSIVSDFENPRFVLIGAYTVEDGKRVMEIWRKIHDKPFYIVRPVEAEIIKLSLNISLVLGITFANMLGEVCEKSQADSNKVLDLIYQDRRNYKPGLGFGGPCFPRDVDCFKALCKESSAKSGYKFAALLSELNDYTLERYYEVLTSSGKKKIGILGLAYKAGVPYVDDSQSLKMAQKLITEGFEVFLYDRLAEENAKNELKGQAFFCSNVKECLDKAEIIFVGTPDYQNVKTEKPVINPWK
jgi:nucleotide sugar dehydrogenase